MDKGSAWKVATSEDKICIPNQIARFRITLASAAVIAAMPPEIAAATPGIRLRRLWRWATLHRKTALFHRCSKILCDQFDRELRRSVLPGHQLGRRGYCRCHAVYSARASTMAADVFRRNCKIDVIVRN